MTEVREGWYWATHKDGQSAPIEVQTQERMKPLFIYGSTFGVGEPPAGWTLSQRIDDLLRDAARYRWLREHYDQASDLWWESTSEKFEADLDAEIAREKADG